VARVTQRLGADARLDAVIRPACRSWRDERDARPTAGAPGDAQARRRGCGELALRPQTIDDFIGQKQVRENLKIFIAAAKSRGEALDHVLFTARRLGKTTLAQIVAREMGVGFRATSGPVIQKRAILPPSSPFTAARRAVHRRDPSPRPVDRGDPLSRDGGFSSSIS